MKNTDMVDVGNNLSLEEINRRFNSVESFTDDEVIEAMRSFMRRECNHQRSIYGDEIFRLGLRTFSRMAGVSDEEMAEEICPLGVAMFQIIAAEAAEASLHACADALGYDPAELLSICESRQAKASGVSH